MNFIVKIFPEVMVKSTPVRRRMSRQLRDNLIAVLKRFDASIRVRQDWDKLEISAEGEDQEKAEALASLIGTVPGIANFARVRLLPLGDRQSILAHVLAAWKDSLHGKTFRVRCKRNGDHDFSSTDIERWVGGELLHETGAKGVDLRTPDVTVQLEIRHEWLYLVEQQYPGLGGFPLGSQEAVVSLMSGGFDSTVASYLSIRRGLRTHFLFFNLGGRAHELAVKEIAFYIWNRYGSSHRVKFISAPFDEVVNEILTKVDASCMGVVLKRCMLRAANQVAERAGAHALVTGEAVAQVSSQTLTNLAVIDRVADKPVLRPLALMDKGDIINLCRKIGAEALAAKVPEYCGVISVRPSAHLPLGKVEEEEAKMDLQTLDRALAAAKMQSIEAVVADLEDSVEAVQPQDYAGLEQVLVDIRHPDECALKPFVTSHSAVLSIPFYSLDSRFGSLDTSKTYLLYCDRGVMSQLHANHLRDKGFTNVGVYRPAG